MQGDFRSLPGSARERIQHLISQSTKKGPDSALDEVHDATGDVESPYGYEASEIRPDLPNTPPPIDPSIARLRLTFQGGSIRFNTMESELLFTESMDSDILNKSFPNGNSVLSFVFISNGCIN